MKGKSMQKDLKSLNLDIKYKSVENDLIEEFYGPVLSSCKKYDRAVGYFSSRILIDYIDSLKTFLRNDGKIRLIISPNLSQQDIDTLNESQIKENDKVEIGELLENLLNTDNETFISTQILFLLIKSNKLEVKIVKPKNTFGIFHEKIGIFKDNNDNVVAISGSNNETNMAINSNLESFNVFCSWIKGQEDYVLRHVSDFEKYWNGEYENIRVYNIKEAIEQKILEKIDTSETIEELYLKKESERRLLYKLKFKPYYYQRDSVDNWFKNNKKGILKFATGAGKTKTAIYLIEKLKLVSTKLFITIVVPDKTLVNQWADEIEEYNHQTIRCFSDNPNWYDSLINSIDIYRISSAYMYIIVTNDTFFGSKFKKQFNKVEKESLLIVDEVHSWGTESILNNLPKVTMSLGLSATPEVYYSEEKTTKLVEYCGGIIAEYSLEQAIKDEKLVKYYYYPIFVGLSDAEREKYKELTKKIVRVLGYETEHFSNNSIAESLLFSRSKIVYNAEQKIDKLNNDLLSITKKGNLLIYCGSSNAIYSKEESDNSLSQLEMVSNILNENSLIYAKYTSQENDFQRKNALKAFEDNTYNILVAIKCLDEGINIPKVERAIIMASSRNPREFIQRRGRILRNHPGKKFAEIYDFIVVDEEFKKLTEKELERFDEFAKIAINKDDLSRIRRKHGKQ
jgi:superfamily II DNA or RNA helicase